MPNSRAFRLGSSSKAGRRPIRYRTDKEVLERVIRQLYEMGVGCVIISRLTGYSQQQVWLYAKDWGIPAASPVKRAEWLMGLLPTNLQADIRMIRTRSDVYHERSRNKGKTSRYVHELGA